MLEGDEWKIELYEGGKGESKKQKAV